MSLAVTTRNNLAAAVFGGVAYQGPATLYAALIVGATNALSGGAEVAGNSYARVAVVNNQLNFLVPTTGVVQNVNVITWPTSSGAWGSVNAVRFFDVASGGSALGGAMLTPAATVDATGITVSVAPLQLSLTISSP
jgi:hypothetical protein